MRPLETLLIFGLLGGLAETAHGELKVVSTSEPARLFAGTAREIAVVWKNSGESMVTADVRMRLLQATTATAAPIGEWPWKKLQVLAGQTVTEHATLDFPEVKAETRFLIKWLEGTNQLFGTTEVLVYPTNLLCELRTLAGEMDESLGLFDPSSTLKPLVKNSKVEFVDLEDLGFDRFRGKLAIVGPFAHKSLMSDTLRERIGNTARKGVAVVWLQPPPSPRDKLQPSFYTVPVSTNIVVVAQDSLVANLRESPRAQLNLLHLCRVALRPEPPRLPQ